MASSRLHTYRNDPWDIDHYEAAGHSDRMAFIRSQRAMEARLATFKDAYLFRVELPTASPPTIWRTIRVHEDITFTKFHKILQIAFGWQNQHLFRFRVYPTGERTQEDMIMSIQDQESTFESREAWEVDGREVKARDERYLSGQTRLKRVFGDKKMDPSTIDVVYEYDLGDGWEHNIEFIGIAGRDHEEALYPLGVKEGQHSFCIDGEGHPCAEDCGGKFGWEEMKVRKVADGTLDPYHWDIIWVNRRLDHMWVDMNAANIRRYWKEVDQEGESWQAEITARLIASEQRLRDGDEGQEEEDVE